MSISTHTRVFAVLGDPVRHSLSPIFQNAAFRAAGIDAVYVALAVSSQDVATVMRTLAANGGGGNVTIPHKRLAASVPGVATPRVRMLGVANVFAADAAGLVLGNTDVDGMLAAVDSLREPADAWYLLGTGGSARAVAGAALERGARIAVKSRDPARAVAFAEWASSLGVTIVEPESCHLVINATPLGLLECDAFPLSVEALPSLHSAIDLTYRIDGRSRWISACLSHGLDAIDGREVLLAQGAASWDLWFPGVTPPIDVMRAALSGCLA